MSFRKTGDASHLGLVPQPAPQPSPAPQQDAETLRRLAEQAAQQADALKRLSERGNK